MPQPKLKVELKKLHPDAFIPEYKSGMAAAFDLHACTTGIGTILLAPGQTKVIPTKIAIFLNNPDYCLEIWERSGLGAKGIGRRAGLVDADYQGEVGVVLTNHTSEYFIVNHGDRIGQAKGIGRRAGLVDADYQGEVGVVLTNHTSEYFIVNHGDRIGQAKVAPVQRVSFDVVEEFSAVTERGDKGYGSTGR